MDSVTFQKATKINHNIICYQRLIKRLDNKEEFAIDIDNRELAIDDPKLVEMIISVLQSRILDLQHEFKVL